MDDNPIATLVPVIPARFSHQTEFWFNTGTSPQDTSQHPAKSKVLLFQYGVVVSNPNEPCTSPPGYIKNCVVAVVANVLGNSLSNSTVSLVFMRVVIVFILYHKCGTGVVF